MKGFLAFLVLAGVLALSGWYWKNMQREKYALPATAEFFKYGETTGFVWNMKFRREVPANCEVYYALDTREAALGLDGAGLFGLEPGRNFVRLKFKRSDVPVLAELIGAAEVFISDTQRHGQDMEMGSVPARINYGYRDRVDGTVSHVANSPVDVKIGGTVDDEGKSYLRLWFTRITTGRGEQVQTESVTYRFPLQSTEELRGFLEDESIRKMRRVLSAMKNPN
jgi:hypothetical protein